MKTFTTFTLLSLLYQTNAFVTPTAFASRVNGSALQATRAEFLQSTFLATLATVALPNVSNAADVVNLPSGVSYSVTNAGSGPKPDIGELAAVRFQASFGDVVIDNIFNTSEPYYTRVGSGGLLKGIEEVIPMMRVGDRWTVTIPGDLAFGKKGRPASAGKPRIPADATIVYDIEMVGLPGKEPELIELIGDE